MKLAKLIALIIAVVCLVACFSACGDVVPSVELPKTAEEYCQYAMDYMAIHAYKMHTKSTTSMSFGQVEDTVDESDTYMDGANMRVEMTLEDCGDFVITYYNGTIYYKTPFGNKKMAGADQEDIDALYDGIKTLSASMLEGVEMTLTKNDDGTAKLEFSTNLLGESHYVMEFDKDCRIIKQTLTMDITVVDITATTKWESTIEYGDQYKVSAPDYADAYVSVDSMTDLLG